MTDFLSRHRKALVWLFRIFVGATFIISGLTKMIDVWGFVYKIEQYLSVWDMPQTRSLVLAVAMALSGIEFLLGFFMITGCYKRTSAWLMTLIMLGMLPLTFYIWVADPVSDCGCFGDFLVISNLATFLKNVVLMAMLIYLAFNNSKVTGLFTAYSQWLVAFVAFLYILVIGLFGYHVQPLIDFRPYKVGTPLITSVSSADDEEPRFVFIYEKDGSQREFEEEELPDSTWTFVDRKEVGSTPDEERAFAVFDGDDDVTAEVLAPDSVHVLLLIPELNDIDVSSTYLVNEMNRYVESRGGRMTGVVGTDDEGLELWRDLSMASYDLFTAENTAIKEIARGNVSVVYMKDGIIRWKRSLDSIDSDTFASPDDLTLDRLEYSGTGYFWLLTLVFAGVELLLWGIDRSGRAVQLHFSRRKSRNTLNKSENPDGKSEN